MGHLNQVHASAWLPWVALCVLRLAAVWGRRGAGRTRLLRGVPWLAAGGAAVALQLTAGHTQEAYYSLLAIGLLAAGYAVFPPARAPVRWTAPGRLRRRRPQRGAAGRRPAAAGDGADATLLPGGGHPPGRGDGLRRRAHEHPGVAAAHVLVAAEPGGDRLRRGGRAPPGARRLRPLPGAAHGARSGRPDPAGGDAGDGGLYPALPPALRAGAAVRTRSGRPGAGC